MDTDQVNKHICLLLLEGEEFWKKVKFHDFTVHIQNKEIEIDKYSDYLAFAVSETNLNLNYHAEKF